MNIFNRIVMVILIVALAALTVFFLVNPVNVLNFAADYIAFLENQIYDYQFFTYLTIIGIILLVVLVVLFILEVRRGRWSVARVQTKGKSDTWLKVESISKSIEYRLKELADVRSAKPRVSSRGKDVDVFVEVAVAPNTNIIMLTDQVSQICQDIIETQLGLKIHNKVKIHIAPEPLLPAAQAKPADARKQQASQPVEPAPSPKAKEG